jgi:hypothetical protein
MLRSALATSFGLGVASLDRISAALGEARRTAAFLRGRLEFRPRSDDVYVVTYPRSGTTWMQFMLYLLTTDGSTDFTHLSQVSPWFERSLAIGSMQAADFEQHASPRILKSHLPWGFLPRPGRYIYIVRDVADVAVSYFHFYRSHLAFEGSLEQFFARFVTGRVQYGSWFRHVEGWRRHAEHPRVHIVHYEQLVTDCTRVMDGVCRFLGLEVRPAALTKVVRRSDFAAMKALENKFDHTTAVLLERGMTPRAFIRQGSVGAGGETLSDAQRNRLQVVAARRHFGPELNLPAFLH